MNAIEQNDFSDAWKKIGTDVLAPRSPAPRAIVCISAHWLTRGTQITANLKQKTIHDFGGFPKQLFEVEYPAPGSPEIAAELQEALAGTVNATLTEEWGLDHGTWSVLVHMSAAADVPVLQLSIDATTSPDMFFKIGEKLRPLREKGILFFGSGNIVHNLSLVDWRRLNDKGFAFDWAREADAQIVKLIEEKNWQPLIDFKSLGKSAGLAINSAEHYVPLLYVLGLSHPDEKAEFFNAEAVGGSLTMTSVRFG